MPNYSAFKGGIIQSSRRAFQAGRGKTVEHADQFADEADVAQADKVGNRGLAGDRRVLASP